MAARLMEAAHTAKQPWINRRLSPKVLEEQNRDFSHTGGVSQANRAYGFLPAFLDAQTGAVYLSRFSDGRVAPIHVLDGLPPELVDQSLITGFVRDGRFFTRAEAAEAVSLPGPSSSKL